MNTVNAQHDEFTERNPFLAALLGVISFARTVDRTTAASSSRRSSSASQTERPADDVELALVGLIRIARRILDHAHTASSPSGPTPAVGSAGTDPRYLRDLLRN